MTENARTESFSANEYLEQAAGIRYANKINGEHMDLLFDNLVIKAQEYKNSWLRSESQIDVMKEVIAKQLHDIKSLHQKLNEMSKKLHNAESTSQMYANKYNRMFRKLKSIILDTTCDTSNDNVNGEQGA